jgi:membrane-associated protease RseP (regulator of RpoE activity)
MKTIVQKTRRRIFWLATIAVMIALPALAEPTAPAAPEPPAQPKAPKVVRIQAIQRSGDEAPAQSVTWLGVYSEEVSEALGSQLNLSSGAGLVITFVAPESPAAKAGLQKNDVLVELGDQLLVNQDQLAKLIRAHKDGDEVTLTFYRQGQKQTLPATLGKSPAEFSAMPVASPAGMKWTMAIGDAINHGVHEQMKTLHGTLEHLGADKEKIQLEVERGVEQARKALELTLRRSTRAGANSELESGDLAALGQGGVSIGKDATIIVKKDGSATKTIVQTDDTGSYILVANPKKRLTAHDKDGKLLFDGEIETEEQQQQVPAAVWEKVKPMLQQMGPVNPEETKPHAETGRDLKS